MSGLRELLCRLRERVAGVPERSPTREIDEVDDNISDDDLSQLANQTPIIRFVNLVLQQAIKDKASDIHFEPYDA